MWFLWESNPKKPTSTGGFKNDWHWPRLRWQMRWVCVRCSLGLCTFIHIFKDHRHKKKFKNVWTFCLNCVYSFYYNKQNNKKSFNCFTTQLLWGPVLRWRGSVALALFEFEIPVLNQPCGDHFFCFLLNICLSSLTPQVMTPGLYHYYVTELAFYWSLMFSQFTDIKRKVRETKRWVFAVFKLDQPGSSLGPIL